MWGLQLPLAIWSSRIGAEPTQGIWWAIAIAMTIHSLLVAGWFMTGRWRRQRV
ncbi:MAG: hypothetical protein GX806_06015 [Lentisphaerae bacterium]|nr:hypothetical protein [Lentisphaerota bacterium]